MIILFVFSFFLFSYIEFHKKNGNTQVLGLTNSTRFRCGYCAWELLSQLQFHKSLKVEIICDRKRMTAG